MSRDNHAYTISEAFKLMYKDEIDALIKICKSRLLRNPIVANIGAGSGTSGILFLECRPDLYLFTIDIENKDSPFGSLFSERKAFEKYKLLDCGRYTQIIGDSKKVGLVFPEQFFDLVFVDGDHSYEGCSGDITSWLPRVKKGGFMAFHDYTRDVWPDVARAVDSMMVDHVQVIKANTLAIYEIK